VSTRRLLAERGVECELISVSGSVEATPRLGLADAIVDLVSTGKTLRANDLVEVEDIMPVSARLVVNQAALKTRRKAIRPLVEAFAKASAR
jgi:ATP phosphoribosyltransferase